ncbi:MAG: hypothetical protein OXN15_07030 [Chloroflexota bacterium]|nr:hypothetical protein [Chloroflexota bacterium]MDE2969072.1 hypothetical protein [Chloroflexota bacterium]
MPPRYGSVYLSARHMRGPELLAARERFVAAGVQVTARWLDGTDLPGGIGPASRQDIERCDAYVLLGDERGDSGHRHVEFGIAMALGKPIVVVAPEAENHWQRLPGVTVVPDWESAYILIGGGSES